MTKTVLRLGVRESEVDMRTVPSSTLFWIVKLPQKCPRAVKILSSSGMTKEKEVPSLLYPIPAQAWGSAKLTNLAVPLPKAVELVWNEILAGFRQDVPLCPYALCLDEDVSKLLLCYGTLVMANLLTALDLFPYL